MGRTPVVHRSCGKQIGWFLGDKATVGNRLRSDEYMRIDGSSPSYGELFREKCPWCESEIKGANDMVRQFEKAESE